MHQLLPPSVVHDRAALLAPIYPPFTIDGSTRVFPGCSSLQAGSRRSKLIIRPGLSEWLAMSSREVSNWLQSHRLGAYVDLFAEHDVTWDDLGELGDEDLRKMGLKTRERRRLLRAIAYDYLGGGR